MEIKVMPKVPIGAARNSPLRSPVGLTKGSGLKQKGSPRAIAASKANLKVSIDTQVDEEQPKSGGIGPAPLGLTTSHSDLMSRDKANAAGDAIWEDN